ncbi:MAG TPA: 5'-nucleotidase C-terminal domain-containing protein [Gemmatimonadales bacterium]|nr:5'-nucleotidase C-terminal domain-containing protein [Gemmatimonadales bacterium]
MRRHIPVLLAALLAASCTPLPPAVPPGPAPIPQDEPITPAEAQPSPGLTRVRIISLNDFHGALRPVEDASGVRRGGAAFVATAIRNAAEGCAEPCAVLVLDGGDTFQGTLPSNLTYGRAVLDVYRAFGVAAAALGNHEFDWGQDTLRARISDAPYAILSANVRDASGAVPSWIRTDTIVERGGLSIGIVGISTLETPSATRASNVAGLEFVDPAESIDRYTRALRLRGADMVVVVAHSGAFCEGGRFAACEGEIVEIARQVKEPIAAIVSGHTHSVVNTVVNGIPIVQARSSGQAIAVLDLEPPEWKSSAQIVSVIADSLAPDGAVSALVRVAEANVAEIVERPVAASARRLTRSGAQHSLGNLIADAQRWASRADVAIMNNGGIRADLPLGDVSYGDVYSVQPFGNTLVRFTVTGEELLNHLETVVASDRVNAHVSGIQVRYDPVLAPGARIMEARLADGRPISPNGSYTIVVNDFIATGGDDLGFGGDAAGENLGIGDLDALLAYLRALPQPFAAPEELRLIPVGL